jgi:hypothetical protein
MNADVDLKRGLGKRFAAHQHGLKIPRQVTLRGDVQIKVYLLWREAIPI